MARTQDTNRGLKMLSLTTAATLIALEQEIAEVPALAAFAQRQDAAAHPRLAEFINWMQQTKGGTRTCPRGGFPDNFMFWLDGGRW
jgi:hypothetical protein